MGIVGNSCGIVGRSNFENLLNQNYGIICSQKVPNLRKDVDFGGLKSGDLINMEYGIVGRSNFENLLNQNYGIICSQKVPNLRKDVDFGGLKSGDLINKYAKNLI